MSYSVLPADWEVVRQRERTVYVKIELLNKKFMTVHELSGELIQDDYSFNADSDIRKTYNITFVIKDSSFTIGRDKKVWLDKYVKPSIGIYSIRNKEVKWYPVGVYIMASAGYHYDSESNVVSIPCLDRVAELSGERGGQLSGTGLSIPSEVIVRACGDGSTENEQTVINTISDAMTNVITQLGKIDDYNISDIGGMTKVNFHSEDADMVVIESVGLTPKRCICNIKYNIADAEQIKNGMFFAFCVKEIPQHKDEEIPLYINLRNKDTEENIFEHPIPLGLKNKESYIDMNIIKEGEWYALQYRKQKNKSDCFFLLCKESINNTLTNNYKYDLDTGTGGYVYQDDIPDDIDFGIGSNVWEIVKSLCDFYPGNEVFFDEETFVCRPIPGYNNAPVVLDEDNIDDFVISEDLNYDFSQIKNVTEVWGKSLDSNYYTEDVDLIGDTYTLSYNTIKSADGVDELSKGLKFAFKADADNPEGVYIRIPISDEAGQTPLPLYMENNSPMDAGRIKKGLTYVIQYCSNGSQSYFYFMGQYQIAAISKLVSKDPTEEQKQHDRENEPTDNIEYIVNPDSPFCSDFEDVGELRQVLSGGEYDNIHSDELAMMRAKYENWLRTNWLNTLNLEMIHIPWIDVNQKVRYKLKSNKRPSYLRDDENSTEQEAEEYIIKSISGSSTGGTMNVSLVKYQALYPWLE